MSTRIVPRAAQVRCNECGAPGAASLCHHCGVALCAMHTHHPGELARMLLSHEFGAALLPESLRNTQPAHCAECAHRLGAPSPAVFQFGAALTVVGMALALWNRSPAALGLAALGLLIALISTVLGMRARASAQNRPPLPIFPRFGSAKIREDVHASVSVNAGGEYHIAQQPAIGSIQIFGRMQSSERERLEAYRKQFMVPPGQNLSYNAGWLALLGKASLRFTPAARENLCATNVLALGGDSAALPMLNGSSPHASEPFNATCSYVVCEPLKPMALAINLVPSLLQEGDQHALALDLQWNAPRQWNAEPLEIERILSLTLDVPGKWGNIERISSEAISRPPENGIRRIEWSQLELDREHPNWQRNSWRFTIHFDSKIDCTTTITARAEVQFGGTLSGLTGVEIFSPLGTRDGPVPGKPITVITTDFALCLAHLRYQDTRVVPDLKRESDENRPKSTTYPGVVPNHQTVSKLTEMLSGREIYIKRIIENPPSTGEHARHHHRYWDIGGRVYDKIYPIDFHLVVSGEEGFRNRARIPCDTTHISLRVQGAFANSAMETSIVKVWDELHAGIDAVLGQQASVPPEADAGDYGAPAQATEHADADTLALDDWLPAPMIDVEQLRTRLYDLYDAIGRGELSLEDVQSEIQAIAAELDQTFDDDEMLQKEVGGQS